MGLTLSLTLHVLMISGLVKFWPNSYTVKAPDIIAIDVVGMIDDPPPPDRPEKLPNSAAPEPVQPVTEPPPPPPPATESAPMPDTLPTAEPPPPTEVQQPKVPKPPHPKPRTERKPPKQHRPVTPPKADSVVDIPPAPYTPTMTGDPPAPSPPVVRQLPRASVETVRDYGRLVWAQISHHKPSNVTFRGATIVSFVLTPDGSLISASVERTSGNTNLDQTALAAVRASSPFPPPPPNIDPSDLAFTISFDFR